MKDAKADKPRTSAKELAIRLGVLQREANQLGLPSVIVIEGIDGSGKGQLLNKLILEIDARTYNIYSTHAGDAPSREYPLLWRMWNHVPADGKVQFYDRSAYYLVLDAWAEGRLQKRAMPAYWKEIQRFERSLADAGTLIAKVFLTVSKKEQARRFKRLQNNSKTAWRVTDKDWRRHEQHDQYLERIEHMVKATDAPHAPWTLIDTDDLKDAKIELYETLIAAFERAVAARREEQATPPPPRDWVPYTGRNHLAEVDLSPSLERARYKVLLKERQAQMYQLAHQVHELKIPVVMAYCGWDAAGKGGCIKRLLQGIDPRSFTVVPVGAPTREELAHHYLWRFWKRMPPRGKFTIFDRSWYGRVLVERVEGLCSNAEWQRAYREMNEMEEHLTRFGAVVIKFWLQIDQDTQLARFRARQEDPLKQWKITDEDWRNREKADRYKEAVNEMLEKTHTSYAPWHVVASTSKEHARVETLDIAIRSLKAAIKRKHLAVL